MGNVLVPEELFLQMFNLLVSKDAEKETGVDIVQDYKQSLDFYSKFPAHLRTVVDKATSSAKYSYSDNAVDYYVDWYGFPAALKLANISDVNDESQQVYLLERGEYPDEMGVIGVALSEQELISYAKLLADREDWEDEYGVYSRPLMTKLSPVSVLDFSSGPFPRDVVIYKGDRVLDQVPEKEKGFKLHRTGRLELSLRIHFDLDLYEKLRAARSEIYKLLVDLYNEVYYQLKPLLTANQYKVEDGELVRISENDPSLFLATKNKTIDFKQLIIDIINGPSLQNMNLFGKDG